MNGLFFLFLTNFFHY